MAVTFKSKGETSTEVKMPTGVAKQTHGTTVPVETDGCQVEVRIGHTKNLGNYESVRFEVGVRVPATMDSLNDTFELCQQWCDKKLSELITELETELGG